MRRIEVLGFDCPACRKTFRLIDTTAHDLGIDIVLEKISGPGRIAAYRALSVPAVAVDGKLVSSGGVPGRKAVEAWLSQG